ncbi:MAG: formate dehydrogenase accessory sulfurtransferase FdhD [Chloroflexota bacterium]
MIDEVVAPAAAVPATEALPTPEDELIPEGELARLPTPTPVVARRYVRFRAGEGHTVEDAVIAEMRLKIVVDGVELVELMCSPHRVNALVLGFLYHEGLIDGMDDVAGVRVCLPDGLAEVWLTRPAPPLPTRRIVTSGCTGGVSFGAYLEEIASLRLPPDDVRVAPERVYVALRQLYDHSALYNQSGGVHTSILLDPSSPPDPAAGLLAVGEDIGRHNTLDKLRGESLLRDFETRGMMVVSSGRISSEMLLKAALMRVPIVGSRTSPTQLAVTLAEHLGLTVIGYIRSASMNVYAGAERVVGAPAD